MLFVVGVGSGSERHFTKEAEEILKNVDLIVCYKNYKKFVERFNKPIYTTGMTREIDRVDYALKEAKDKDVALVSSGDATIYGLASLAYEINAVKGYNVDIKVIPGITAASLASAILGSPLNHDFVVISFSDLLTPLEKILKRFRCALEGDFVICIYNPLSKRRKEPFLKAVDILAEFAKNNNYVIGIVKNAGRDKEEALITNFKEFYSNLDKYLEFIDMNTILIIGNSSTKAINNKMITPRGYLNKYKI
ncbi:precorrin-3B C(17)-methyltransferase [Methanocaldococcus fervens]|uniref:Precorrin-3B C17-methyltransferase n=1 Tax=Methanocaldococcus fervens (strain DSM 4213 / JCM 15782 / AG86) TaxID=573064 RepID=C7P8V5_METFA|nr:precorrin-3B C(17)-methyltransferase [Methanocaldococcus fervens]ACV24987.1 precorrin-3B C17-methyltransferase [Methanocaldococcus fervens AG86]